MDYSLLMGVHNLDAPQKEAAIEEVQLHLDGAGNAIPSAGASDGETSQKKPDPSKHFFIIGSIGKKMPGNFISEERKVVRQKTKFSAWESIQAEALPVELGDEYPYAFLMIVVLHYSL